MIVVVASWPWGVGWVELTDYSVCEWRGEDSVIFW